MREPASYRLGIYDDDPDSNRVEFSECTFPNTPLGIDAMRAAIREYYDRGNTHCVGIFPAPRKRNGKQKSA